jgi:hypothetical protein
MLLFFKYLDMLYSLISHGPQDVMLLGRDIRMDNFYNRFRNKCVCGDVTYNTTMHHLDVVLCQGCKSVVDKLIHQTIVDIKRQFAGVKINLIGAHQYYSIVSVVASDPDLASTHAGLIAERLNNIWRKRRIISVTNVTQPERIRELEGGINWVVNVVFNVAKYEPVEVSYSGLIGLCLKAIKGVAGFETLPSELLDPIVDAQPILGVRFMFTGEN